MPIPPTQAGPALPWASDAPSAHVNPLACLKVDDRIEVRWQLEEEAGAPVVKWWGATIIEIDDSSTTCKIRYDESNGFESEEVQVEILSPDYLQHIGSEDELRWKREGAVVAESDSEIEPGDQVMSLRELTEEQAELERVTGRSLEETALQHLSQSLQPAQQVEVLTRFQDFADHFRNHLQQLAQENSNRVITEDDINDICQSFGRS